MKNVLIIAVALTAVTIAGCRKQSTVNETAVSAKPHQPTPAIGVTREEPLYELSPKKFREAWIAFTKDGRYRMAQTKEVAGMPYHYGFFNDVLVIVVDQTLSDESRLRLVYFKPAETDNRDYKLFWVHHNFQLATRRHVTVL